ncbi:hypothetical protein FRC18_009122 [Serendipita sp. 400]|nr:hypothetical protein FRC18_009122 [Serendipita sp. 400]
MRGPLSDFGACTVLVPNSLDVLILFDASRDPPALLAQGTAGLPKRPLREGSASETPFSFKSRFQTVLVCKGREAGGAPRKSPYVVL